jgi:molybdate/tungstate transport system permease protein
MNRKRILFNLLFALAGSLLVLFVVLPLVSTILSTTPGAFLKSFGDPEVLHSIGLTFGAAAIATALAMLTGVPLAYLLARHFHG